MKQLLSLVTILSLLVGTSWAQCGPGGNCRNVPTPPLPTFDNYNASMNNLVNEINFSGQGANQLKGNRYLYTTASSGEVKFINLDKAHSFESIRYNALTNDLEVIYQDKTMYIRGTNVSSFTLNRAGKTQKFVNLNAYASTGKKEVRFAEIVQDGQVQMLKKIALNIEKPNYNVALSVGEKNYKISRKTKLFLSKKDKLHLVKTRKDVYKFFAANDFNAKSFAKKNRVKVNREKGLIQLVQSYNKIKIIDKKTNVIAKADNK